MNTPLPATAAEAFDALADATAQVRAAEIGEVLAIARAVDAYRVDHADVMAVFDACYRGSVDGTGGVGEFLVLEVAGILGVSQGSAASRIADVLTVREQFPYLWSVFLTGELRWWQVAEVVNRPDVAALSVEARRWLDHQLSIAMRTQSWQKVRSRIGGWVLKADPAAAKMREAQAREDRHVWVAPIQDGHCGLYGRLAARDAVDFDHALTTVAATIPTEAGSLDQRRAAAVGVLARQAVGQDVLPEVTLVVHIDADDPALSGNTETCGVAEVERWGALLTAQLPEFLKDSKVTVRPVIDPWRLTPQNGHDPSVGLWTAVTALMSHDMFPYSAVPSRRCDIDHTIPFDEETPGLTRWGNLAPLSRKAHRGKTFGGWVMTQPAPGVVHWRSPAGFEYLVTAWGGTIRLKRPNPVPRVEEPPPPRLDQRKGGRERSEKRRFATSPVVGSRFPRWSSRSRSLALGPCRDPW